MAFTIPTFNLTAGFWGFGGWPAAPVTLVFPCNLQFARKGRVEIYPPPAPAYAHRQFMWLLCPAGTNIWGFMDAGGVYPIIEVPNGTGRGYSVVQVDDVAKGFANEYRVAMIVQTVGWPIPIP